MDSELQIALIGAGLAAVVLVVGYNKWQERKHRRDAERAFRSEHRDVLLEPRTEADAGDSAERREPGIGAGEGASPRFTDAPLKRAIMPNGGWRMVEGALETYGYEVDQTLKTVFSEYRKTHNQGVFDVYPPNVRAARSSHIITGLPDAYGRGRIIGDYRRVALYGVDQLIAAKKIDKLGLDTTPFTEQIAREREEHAEQIRALQELKQMAASYGIDISGPATTAKEAVQWLYFAYLGAVKEQNGAAMSLGRTSTFLDVFIQRDLEAGTLTETEAQEIIDDFVIKLRIVRFLRTRGQQADHAQAFRGPTRNGSGAVGALENQAHIAWTVAGGRWIIKP